jgi:hypothetical protein
MHHRLVVGGTDRLEPLGESGRRCGVHHVVIEADGQAQVQDVAKIEVGAIGSTAAPIPGVVALGFGRAGLRE